MATCPYCKGHLTEGHRCPRRPSVMITEMIACAIGGGLAAWLLLAAFDPRGQATDLDGITAADGAAIAVALNRLFRSL